MIPIFRILLAIEFAALIAVGYLGFTIDSVQSALEHVNAGVFVTVLTVFMHCLALFYLNGTARAIKDAIADHPDLAEEYVPFTQRIRRRAYPPATFAILLMLITAWAGAYVHSDLLAIFKPRVELGRRFVELEDRSRPPASLEALSSAERERLARLDPADFETVGDYERAIERAIRFPVREAPLWWIHIAALVVALGANVWAFEKELVIIGENGAGIRRLNATLAERDAAGTSA